MKSVRNYYCVKIIFSDLRLRESWIILDNQVCLKQKFLQMVTIAIKTLGLLHLHQPKLTIYIHLLKSAFSCLK